MTSILILLVGVAVVIGGILFLRMHAFLALIVAALIVSLLTPRSVLQAYRLTGEEVAYESYDAAANQFVLSVDQKLGTDESLVVLRQNSKWQQVAKLVVLDAQMPQKLAKVEIDPASNQAYAYQPGDLLFRTTSFAAARKFSQENIGSRVATAFGDTCAKIGILIAMAAIIGKCLLESGAADRIVRSCLKLFGEAGAGISFVVSGFLLSVPVFFDTVFYLMIPLAKAMRLRTGKNYLLYVLAIFAGGTMAHSLVPPTPGPLLVASELGVDLGTMMLMGCLVGSFTSMAGFGFAWIANRMYVLPLRQTDDAAAATAEPLEAADVDHAKQKPESIQRSLPPLWLALMPVVLPVVLIAGNTISGQFESSISPGLMRVIENLGDRNVALTISAAIAIAILIQQRRTNRQQLSASLQSALASGGVIILITASGGAFGKAIEQTGIAHLIQALPTGSLFVTLPLAFALTAAIRTAQGSATVAMITSVGILASIARQDLLGFHPVYLALAIGCGSKPLSWMNDSGFWVICKMSGMNESEGLRLITPMSGVMGIVGLIVTMIVALMIPL